MEIRRFNFFKLYEFIFISPSHYLFLLSIHKLSTTVQISTFDKVKMSSSYGATSPVNKTVTNLVEQSDSDDHLLTINSNFSEGSRRLGSLYNSPATAKPFNPPDQSNNYSGLSTFGGAYVPHL